jgi:hypothetical protein
MSPRLTWHDRERAPLTAFRVGDVVIPDEHPVGCARWVVTETDGAVALLTATETCTPSQIKRHASAMRKAVAS